MKNEIISVVPYIFALFWTNIAIPYWLWSQLRLCQYLCITMTDCLMITSQASTDRKQTWILASLRYIDNDFLLLGIHTDLFTKIEAVFVSQICVKET